MPNSESPQPRSHFIEVEYEQENAPVIVGNEEVGRVQRTRFRFGVGVDFLRYCIPYGSVASAIGATVYFLAKRLYALVTSVAAQSVIFEVITSDTDQKFAAKVENGTIKRILDEAFDDIEKSIGKALGGKGAWKRDMPDEELSKLKEIRILTVKLCSEQDLDIAMQKLENELDEKAAANELKDDGPSRYRLWNSDLRSLLDEVCQESVAEETVLNFLLKCKELGITKEKDFDYLRNEQINDKFDAVLSVVELRKFMDYVKGKRTTCEAEASMFSKKRKLVSSD